MKKYIQPGFVFVFTIFLLSTSCQNQQETPAINTKTDTISYCVGVMFGSNLQRDGFDTVNTRLMAQGLEDYFGHKKLTIDQDMSKKILEAYRGEILKKRLLAKFQDNKAAGEKFLLENKKQKGIVTLPSGLQYKILKRGKGPRPDSNDLVLVHYKGKLIDGTVFEDHMTGKPVPFFVNRVIAGWKEALLRMPRGSLWRIYIPYSLGYGTEYKPNSLITPYSTLIFDIELVNIKHYQ
ncbi:MAG: FKBP-type peptidyl-prolyl cis-trans isomerase [Bacteroidales bacterium]|nr:FKBP-type peptidyl-prolyl cis-trans isomerase [Bacteroidales bacterium]